MARHPEVACTYATLFLEKFYGIPPLSKLFSQVPTKLFVKLNLIKMHCEDSTYCGQYCLPLFLDFLSAFTAIELTCPCIYVRPIQLVCRRHHFLQATVNYKWVRGYGMKLFVNFYVLPTLRQPKVSKRSQKYLQTSADETEDWVWQGVTLSPWI